MRIIALLLVAALAGCLGGSDEPTDSSSSSSSSTEPMESEFDVTALNGTFLANVTEGFTPLAVNFTIGANYILNGTEEFDSGRDEMSVEEVGGAFHWAFDQDSDGSPEAEGTEVPINITVLYATEGFHNATVTMAGQNLTWNHTIQILTEAFVPRIPPTIYEGIVQEVCPSCSSEQGGYSASFSHTADMIGIDGTWGAIPSDLAGSPFIATTTAGKVGISFQATCNGDEIEAFPAAKTIVGTVPAGAGCVWMWEDSNVRGSKLSFIANGDLTELPDDGLCWAPDGVLIGQYQATGLYITDGTWFYVETNSVPGLQWSGEIGPEGSAHKEGCEGGDMLII